VDLATLQRTRAERELQRKDKEHYGDDQEKSGKSYSTGMAGIYQRDQWLKGAGQAYAAIRCLC